MNKYQEALDCVTGITRKMLDNPTVEFSKKYLESIKLLEELVDKATPKKIIRLPKLKEYGYRCPTCNANVDYHFCINCGQALDWTDDATSE